MDRQLIFFHSLQPITGLVYTDPVLHLREQPIRMQDSTCLLLILLITFFFFFFSFLFVFCNFIRNIYSEILNL